MKSEGEKRLWLLTIMLIAYGLVYFHRVMTGVMKHEIVSLAKYYSIEPKFLLSIFPSAYFYSYALIQPFVGTMVDSYGVKRVGALMLALMGMSTALMSLPSPIALVAGRLLVGSTAAVVFLASQRIASHSFSSLSQVMITAILLVVGNISSLLATYPLRLFLSAYGIVPLFLLLSGMCLFITALAFALSKDLGSSKRGIGLKKTWREMLSIAKSSHTVATTMGSIAVGGTGLAFHASWGQDLMATFFGMTEEDVSIYLMILSLALIVANFAAGFLSDKVLHRRKPLLTIATMKAIIGWIVICIACSSRILELFTIGLLILGVAMGFAVVGVPMVKEPFGQDYAATATAVFNLLFFSSVAVIQSIEPFIGPWHTLILSLAISILGAIVARTYAIETLSPSIGPKRRA
ncbi:MAG: MFS transporter [Candidatus Nezhaarchaeales archaeon]